MVLRVDILIYVYIALCACTYIYDFVYTRRKNHSEEYYRRKKDECREYITQLSKEERPPQQKDKLVRKLRKPAFTAIFHDVIMKLLQNEDTRAMMQEWIWKNRDVFLEIRDTYVDTKQANRKAFYAYMVWQYGLCSRDEHDIFVRTMQSLVMEASTYCRENALCALYAAGEVANVLKAYLLMSKNDIQHSPKLVTDGLLTFSGNHREMGEALWENHKLFTTDYVVAFINYIRMASDGFEERFIELLKDTTVDLEIRLAAIRYYRSHPCDEAIIFMEQAVLHWQDYPWEVAAQAALVLEKSSGMGSIRALMKGCESTNWYVRKNSAESLLKLTDDHLAAMIINNEEDRYARDMLQYVLSRKQGRKDDGRN